MCYIIAWGWLREGKKVRYVRRLLAVLAISSSLFIPCRYATAQNKETPKARLSLKLCGGLGYIGVGDINHHIASFDKYMVDSLSFYGGGRMRGIASIVPEFEAELRIRINPKLALALGSGYISGSRKDDFQTAGRFPLFMSDASDAFYEFVLEPRIRAIPVKLGLYYSRPLARRVDLLLNGGLGIYFSKAAMLKLNNIVFLNVNTIPEMPSIYSQFNVHGTGIGFHGGIGLEYRLLRGLYLVFDAQGLYAKVGQLSGSEVLSYQNSYNVFGETFNGILYIGTRDLTAQGYSGDCPDMLVSPSPTMKRASLDFSGVSLRVGVRITLF